MSRRPFRGRSSPSTKWKSEFRSSSNGDSVWPRYSQNMLEVSFLAKVFVMLINQEIDSKIAGKFILWPSFTITRVKKNKFQSSLGPPSDRHSLVFLMHHKTKAENSIRRWERVAGVWVRVSVSARRRSQRCLKFIFFFTRVIVKTVTKMNFPTIFESIFLIYQKHEDLS